MVQLVHERPVREMQRPITAGPAVVRDDVVVGQHERSSGQPRSLEPGDATDRKSTRLNSSHSQISYAVFCLKKKKNIISDTTPQTLRENSPVQRVAADI